VKEVLYAGADTDSKLPLDINVVSRRGTGPAAAFLHWLTQKHDVAEGVLFIGPAAISPRPLATV